MNKIAYTELSSPEPGAMCYPCSEYKGMVGCPDCGFDFCVFCTDGCEACGAEIDFSA